MSRRALIGLMVLGLLIAGNIVWRIWSGWGLVTIDADNAPVAEVVRSLEKQSGVRVATNLPQDRTVTMHVRRVPLMRAVEVLSNTANASWDVAYLTGPDKVTMEAGLISYAEGGTGDWKVFAIPSGPMGMMGGSVDPRKERLVLENVEGGNLHDYLAAAASSVDGQFWVPGDWNPAVGESPSKAEVDDYVAALAKSAGGKSEPAILISDRAGSGGPQVTGVPSGNSGPPTGGGQRPAAFDPAAMEKRALARIEAMPAAKQEEARKEFEERRKFFAEMASLPEEERREKMREHMEQEMKNNPERMQDRMDRMGASRTVEQRREFFRRVIQHKQEAAGQ